MNDEINRLLELAAKAVGVKIKPCTCRDPEQPYRREVGGHWEPHMDGGDCMILVTRLGLRVDVDWDCSTATAVVPYSFGIAGSVTHVVNIPEGSDGFAETRLAILRAAAAIGETMPC